MVTSLLLSRAGQEKLSGLRTGLVLGGLGAGLGALYGIGDIERNYDQRLFDSNTVNRAAQGALTGIGAFAGAGALPSILPSAGRIGGGLLGGLGALLLSDRIMKKDNEDPFYSVHRAMGI